jgi:hypothetical protein
MQEEKFFQYMNNRMDRRDYRGMEEVIP